LIEGSCSIIGGPPTVASIAPVAGVTGLGVDDEADQRDRRGEGLGGFAHHAATLLSEPADCAATASLTMLRSLRLSRVYCAIKHGNDPEAAYDIPLPNEEPPPRTRLLANEL
jgi:hypothetical protein